MKKRERESEISGKCEQKNSVNEMGCIQRIKVMHIIPELIVMFLIEIYEHKRREEFST